MDHGDGGEGKETVSKLEKDASRWRRAETTYVVACRQGRRQVGEEDGAGRKKKMINNQAGRAGTRGSEGSVEHQRRGELGRPRGREYRARGRGKGGCMVE